MKLLAVKDWGLFQHYSKRNPPWIKLHRAVLDDYAFCALSDAAKGHLILLWLYASQCDGKVPYDVPFLERKLSCTGIDLDLYVKNGFLIDPHASSGKPAGG